MTLCDLIYAIRLHPKYPATECREQHRVLPTAKLRYFYDTKVTDLRHLTLLRLLLHLLESSTRNRI